MTGTPARDRRLWPANDRVAHDSLAGQVEAPLTPGRAMQVSVPVADICDRPWGTLDRQLLFGHRFTLLEERNGWAFGRAEPSGYVGHVRIDALEEAAPRTHRVCTLGAHAYPAPDMKTRPDLLLPYGAFLHAEGQQGHFLNCGHGWVHEHQLEDWQARHPDPAAVAEMFLGVPYLWGGDSTLGIDCSGLIHIAMRAACIDCPRDSDHQAAGLGTALAPDAELERGDVVFWDGHVALMVDREFVVHANGYHMAVVREPLEQAVARIAASGGGDVTVRRRVALGG